MLNLYFKKGCPFCQKVLECLHQEVGADVQILYKGNADNAQKAKEIGGKSQVPLLVDEERDVVMYESDDIADYLRKNYGG